MWKRRDTGSDPDHVIKTPLCSMCKRHMMYLWAPEIATGDDGAKTLDLARAIWACEKDDLRGGPAGPETPEVPT